MEFREFTKVDWYGYAGAEPPMLPLEAVSYGQRYARFEPLLVYVSDTYRPDAMWTIIVDAHGITADLCCENEGCPPDVGVELLQFPVAWPYCLIMARTMQQFETVDKTLLQGIGFKEVF